MRRIAAALGLSVALIMGSAEPADAGSHNLQAGPNFSPGQLLARQYDGDLVYLSRGTNQWGIAQFYTGLHRRSQYRVGGVIHYTSCSWTKTRGFWFTMNANTAVLATAVCP
jgi:hypothetical protein